jgi:hypothetical protein
MITTICTETLVNKCYRRVPSNEGLHYYKTQNLGYILLIPNILLSNNTQYNCFYTIKLYAYTESMRCLIGDPGHGCGTVEYPNLFVCLFAHATKQAMTPSATRHEPKYHSNKRSKQM